MTSKIEWTQETWNPIVGCSKVSPGCQHCYAERMAKRLKAMGVANYQDVVDENGWTGIMGFVPGALLKPYRWKKPRMVFVGSMNDILHNTVQDWALNAIMGTIAKFPQHIFQILTKRAERMAEYFSTHEVPDNLWVGVTAENREMANKRIPYLLHVKAKVRFVSIEPMLGPVDLSMYLPGTCVLYKHRLNENPVAEYLDWVIAGGESGPGARPMHPDWVRNLRDQCQAANVPFFFKQWGEWSPDCLCRTKEAHREIDRLVPGGGGVMFRCGKKAAGRLLDGEVWDQIPG